MLNRNFLYQPTPGSRYYKYANSWLKIKDFRRALTLFHLVTKDPLATDRERSIAYIRIGEFFLHGDLSNNMLNSGGLQQSDTLAKHYFNLGLKASKQDHPLKTWAESYIKKIDAKRNIPNEVTSKMTMATIN